MCIEVQTKPPPAVVAVEVKQACKSYDATFPVLKNMNMTVFQGSIYSLLGSSGCGKTTMLSCIVGTLGLDTGDVFVFGQRPGTPESGIPGRGVGYMPQGVTLYPLLSIAETFQYFGKICGMTGGEISRRTEVFSNILNLPSAAQKVGSLSGGQQRRISLAVCLLHEPPLLILDEPTVGVDPLIQESIWNYLCEIVERKKTTVIITTHYIEEARKSHMVGVMRSGRLLVEEEPNALMEKYNAALLKDVVLKLCLEDESGKPIKSIAPYERERNEGCMNVPSQKNYARRSNQSKSNKQAESANTVSFKPKSDEVFPELFNEKVAAEESNSFLKFQAIFIRNILLLLRNPTTLYLAFFAPVMHLVVSSFIVGHEPRNLPFGVINPEIQNSFGICESQRKDSCNYHQLSCGFINLLSAETILPIFENSVEDALEGVKAGKLSGYMAFPRNYSEQLMTRFLTGRFADEEVITGSTVQFRMDMSNYLSGLLLQKRLYETYQSFIQSIIQSCNLTEYAYKVELPLKFRDPIYGSMHSSYVKNIASGVLLQLAFFYPCFTSTLALLVDRKQGTLDRSMVAGASASIIMTAHFVTEILIVLVQTTFSIVFIVLFFGWEAHGSFATFLSLVVLTGIGGISFGAFSAQVLSEISEGIFVLLGLFVFQMYYIGILWPIEGTPLLVQVLSSLFPLSWVVPPLRSIMDRGWSIMHLRVLSGFGVLVATTLLFVLLSIKFWKAR